MPEIAPDATVFVVTGGNRHGRVRLHTERDCRSLAGCENVVSKVRQMYPDDQPECAYCTDEFEPSGGGSDHYKALVEAADV